MNRFEKYMPKDYNGEVIPPRSTEPSNSSLTREQRMEMKANKARQRKETDELEDRQMSNAVRTVDDFKSVVYEKLETAKMNGKDTKKIKHKYKATFPDLYEEARQDIEWMDAVADDIVFDMPYDPTNRTQIAL